MITSVLYGILAMQFFISKSKYHGLLLANLTFDIFEVYRKKAFNLLNKDENLIERKKIVEEHYHQSGENGQ